MSSQLDLHLHAPYTIGRRADFVKKCRPLYKAAVTGNWRIAQKVINEDKSVVDASITEGGETALHLAASGKNNYFVEKLLSNMNDLRTTNRGGNTALCFAAAAGNLKIVKLMVNKDNNLPVISGPGGVKPIYMAAVLGHGDIVNFLYPSDFTTWPIEERSNLLTACTASGVFDVALKMILQDPKLLRVLDRNGDTALDVLVRMSSAFAEKATCLCSPKRLLQSILVLMLHSNKQEICMMIDKCPGLILKAAQLGNLEFVIVLLQNFPDLIWTSDNHNRTIFHHAILNRHCGIFKLIYEADSIRSFLASKRDADNNNMLHLAARLAPQNVLAMTSGAALQMQQELLWFKEVREMVEPSYRYMKNNNGETPGDIFAKEHATLMLQGENWLKETASSSMVVATIITSGVFATIFTVPGGVDDKGVPHMSQRALMKVFYISEAIGLFSSSTSVLMFLSIITSRYAQSDFVHSLPLKLMAGLATLVVSLASMVVAFCGSIVLSYQRGYPWIHVLLGVFSLVPIVCVVLMSRLLRDVICCTYRARNMFQPQGRLFH